VPKAPTRRRGNANAKAVAAENPAPEAPEGFSRGLLPDETQQDVASEPATDAALPDDIRAFVENVVSEETATTRGIASSFLKEINNMIVVMKTWGLEDLKSKYTEQIVVDAQTLMENCVVVYTDIESILKNPDGPDAFNENSANVIATSLLGRFNELNEIIKKLKMPQKRTMQRQGSGGDQPPPAGASGSSTDLFQNDIFG
jgi:hypothetical protein